VSRERALRREQVEQERVRRAATHERQVARATRRRGRGKAVREALPRLHRGGRPQGLLARRRRMQNSAVLGFYLLVLLLLWLLTDSWWVRLGGAIVTLLALPVLVTVVFDRRTRS
jgi:Flp pilus assembly protein TadB